MIVHKSECCETGERETSKAWRRRDGRSIEDILTPIAPAAHVPGNAVSVKGGAGESHRRQQPQPPAREPKIASWWSGGRRTAASLPIGCSPTVIFVHGIAVSTVRRARSWAPASSLPRHQHRADRRQRDRQCHQRIVEGGARAPSLVKLATHAGQTPATPPGGTAS